MPGLLKLFLSTTLICMHMCVHPRLIITPYDWLNKFYNLYRAAEVGIVSRHGLSIDVHHRNQPKE